MGILVILLNCIVWVGNLPTAVLIKVLALWDI